MLTSCLRAPRSASSLLKGGVVHRLDQVRVKAGFLGAAAILVLTPASQGHQHRAACRVVLFTNPPSRFVAVEAWQADVEQDHVGLKLAAASTASRPS